MIRTVVISSTVLDLPDHRQKVRDACQLQDVVPFMMEQLPASAADAIDASMRLVDRADCYIGVLANRYGYIPAGREISITEMEYNRAVERGIPRLIFIEGERYASIAEGEEPETSIAKLKAFKERVATHNIVNRFTSPEELKGLVINSLSHARGWDQEAPRPSTAETRARARYLRDLREHLENLRHDSLQNARFIDLGIADSPAATQLRGVYRNPESAQEFGSLGEALRAYDQRLLLLGAPGGGKTTTLQHLALEFVREAQQNRSAPIPVLVNLSKFSVETREASLIERLVVRGVGERRDAHDHRFERWLEAEISTLYDVPRQVARSWVAEDQIAALFDGLDEVALERRSDIVRLLNATYLREHPDTPTVVCSRVAEYQLLMDDARTRLRLRGAVTLQPLDDQQVEQYLSDTMAGGLAEALKRDESLKLLARTPLMLSMMTLAYGNRAAEEIPADESQAVQRYRLMQTFVARMLERKEKRDRQALDPGARDALADKDYGWLPAKFERYMGWLALRLSLRSQTACSVKAFWDLVAIAPNRLNPGFDSWLRRCSYAVLLVMLMSGIAATVAGAAAAVPWLVLRGTGGAIALYWAGTMLEKSPWKLGRSINGLGVFVIYFALFGAMMRGMAALVPVHLSLMAVEMIVWCGFLTLIFGASNGFVSSGFLVANAYQFSVAGAMTAVYLGFLRGSTILVRVLPPTEAETPPDYDGLAVLVIAFAAHGAFWYVMTRRSRVKGVEPASIGVVLFGGAFAMGILLWSSELAPRIAVPDAIGLVALVLFGFAENGSSAAVLALTGVSAALGGRMAGKDGMFGGLGMSFFGSLAASSAMSNGGVPRRLQTIVTDVEGLIDRILSRAILAPTARIFLGLSGRLPYRLVPLLRYGSQALILKPYRGEIEFAHRLLRDYFALGDLVPKLRASQNEDRLRLIDALGYQGASAIDTLAELTGDGSLEQRSAALAALSRIAAPEVADLLRKALKDPVPEIRAAAVFGLAGLPQQTREELAATVADDPEPRVQKALFTIASADARSKMVPRMVRQRELLMHVLTFQDLPTYPNDKNNLLTSSSAIPLNLEASMTEEIACALRQMLVEGDAAGREKAAQWMQCCKPVFDGHALVTVLMSDPQWQVREAAVSALRQWDYSGASSAIAEFREAAERRYLAGRIRLHIRRELGRKTWELARRVRIPGGVLAASALVLGVVGPVFVPPSVNWMATAVVTISVFLFLDDRWYTALGEHGTFHQTTTMWDRGWRGNGFAKGGLFLLLCATAVTVMYAMKNPSVSPLPSYFTERMVLETRSPENLWPGEPVNKYELGSGGLLFTYEKARPIQTRVVDEIDSSALGSLPLVSAVRGYRWETFEGVQFSYREYTGYLLSNYLEVALRPMDFVDRADRIKMQGAVSWPVALAGALQSPGDDEAELLTGLKKHPAVQRGIRRYGDAVVRLAGWADLELWNKIAEGPVLLIATSDGTATAVAILAPTGALGKDCRAVLARFSSLCR